MSPLPRYHTVKDLADAWRCSTSHIYALVNDGSLQAEDIARPGARRRNLRFTDEAIAEFRGQPLGRPALTLVPAVA